jgi:hypothetical protein
MSDTKYNIKRWDSVIINDSTIPYPLIYIKPDKNFLDFLLLKNNIIELSIHDTDSIYDNKKIIGLVRPSINTPNCRVNFFNKTGYYCVILFADWHTYPYKLGYFTIKGLTQPENLIKETFINNQISKIVKHSAPSVVSPISPISPISPVSPVSHELYNSFLYDNLNTYTQGLSYYGAILTSIVIFILLAVLICISYFKNK